MSFTSPKKCFSGPSPYYLPCTYLLDENLSGRLRCQLYKWVLPVDLLLRITLRYTNIIPQGNIDYSSPQRFLLLSLRRRSTQIPASNVCKVTQSSLFWAPNGLNESPEVRFEFSFIMTGKSTMAF